VNTFHGAGTSNTIETDPSPSSSSSTSQEDEEEVMRLIFETLSQMDEERKEKEDYRRSLGSALSLIHSPQVRLVILTNLLDMERQRRKNNPSQMIHYLSKLVSSLDEKQNEELKEIIRGLPPAVLGDTFARDTSRVLVDLYSDVKDSVREDKAKVSKKRKFIDSITDIFHQSLSRLDLEDGLTVITLILHDQDEPALKMKVVIQQLLLAHSIPHDISSRETLLQILYERTSSSLL